MLILAAAELQIRQDGKASQEENQVKVIFDWKMRPKSEMFKFTTTNVGTSIEIRTGGYDGND